LRNARSDLKQNFETSQWVPFTVEEVFAFFAVPANLPLLMPPEQQARIEEIRLQPPPPVPFDAVISAGVRNIAAGTGSEIVVSFRPVPLLPLRLNWTARIVEFEWNSHFVDEMVHGPFKRMLHRHSVAAESRSGVTGAVLTDRVEYVLPGGAIGNVADPQVRAKMEKGFAFRQKRLPLLLAEQLMVAVR
jgi:ligand-binding SRPBCC domain-containing protein